MAAAVDPRATGSQASHSPTVTAAEPQNVQVYPFLINLWQNIVERESKEGHRASEIER